MYQCDEDDGKKYCVYCYQNCWQKKDPKNQSAKLVEGNYCACNCESSKAELFTCACPNVFEGSNELDRYKIYKAKDETLTWVSLLLQRKTILEKESKSSIIPYNNKI